MINRNIDQLSLDQIIFEKRNRDYGAFEIRNIYNYHLRNSALIVLFTFGIGLFIVKEKIFQPNENLSRPDIIIQQSTKVDKEVIDLIEQMKRDRNVQNTRQAAQHSSATSTTTRQAHSQASNSPSHTSTQNMSQNISANVPTFENLDFDIPDFTESDLITEFGDDFGTGNGSGNGLGLDGVPNHINIVSGDQADNYPEFPGDIDQYLQKQMKYNTLAQMGISGKIKVIFVVNSEGHVTNIQVTGEADQILKNKAIEAFRKMPQWKPGDIKGKPVSIRMAIPINFTIN